MKMQKSLSNLAQAKEALLSSWLVCHCAYLDVWQLRLFHNVAHHTRELVIDRKRISAADTKSYENCKSRANKRRLQLLPYTQQVLIKHKTIKEI